MSVKSANAVWNGDLTSGTGRLTTPSKKLDTDYGWKARSEDGTPGTSPEELIAAAHAGCYSMALAHALAEAGHRPDELRTRAEVSFGKVADGFAITGIKLVLDAKVPGLADADFQTHADKAKKGCPVSKALAAVPITLEARLGNG